MTAFIAWALSLVASPSVPNPPLEIPQGMAWCGNRLCGQIRTYDVLPGAEPTKLYQGFPDYAFCTHCGTWLPDVFPEEETA